jgi:hypothetical protein
VGSNSITLNDDIRTCISITQSILFYIISQPAEIFSVANNFLGYRFILKKNEKLQTWT